MQTVHPGGWHWLQGNELLPKCPARALGPSCVCKRLSQSVVVRVPSCRRERRLNCCHCAPVVFIVVVVGRHAIPKREHQRRFIRSSVSTPRSAITRPRVRVVRIPSRLLRVFCARARGRITRVRASCASCRETHTPYRRARSRPSSFDAHATTAPPARAQRHKSVKFVIIDDARVIAASSCVMLAVVVYTIFGIFVQMEYMAIETPFGFSNMWGSGYDSHGWAPAGLCNESARYDFEYDATWTYFGNQCREFGFGEVGDAAVVVRKRPTTRASGVER